MSDAPGENSVKVLVRVAPEALVSGALALISEQVLAEAQKGDDERDSNLINTGTEAIDILTNAIAKGIELRSPFDGFWLVPSQTKAKHWLASAVTCTCPFGTSGERRNGKTCKHMLIAEALNLVAEGRPEVLAAAARMTAPTATNAQKLRGDGGDGLI